MSCSEKFKKVTNNFTWNNLSFYMCKLDEEVVRKEKLTNFLVSGDNMKLTLSLVKCT